MKYLILLLLFLSSMARAQSPWYYGAGKAVNLENAIEYKNKIKNIAGSLDPTAVAVNAPAGSLYESTNGKLYVKQDSGSSTNWFPIASGPAGVPSTVAGFDGSGNLYSLPTWSFTPYIKGLSSSASSLDGSTQTSIERIYTGTSLGDGVSGHIDNYTDIFTQTNTNANISIDSFTGFRSYFNASNAAPVTNATTFDGSSSGNILGNYTGINAYKDGAVGGNSISLLLGINSAVTGSHTGINVNQNGNSDSTTLIQGSVGSSTITNGITGVNISASTLTTSSSLNGFSLGSQGVVTGDAQGLTFFNNGTVGGNFYSVNSQNQGIVTGEYNGVSLGQSNAAASHGANIFKGNNQAPVLDYFNGLFINNNGAISGSGNLTGMEFSNGTGGTATNITGLRVNNQAVASANLQLIQLLDNSTSPVSARGMNVNLQGTYTDLHGIDVDVSAAITTSGTRAEAIRTNGPINAGMGFSTVSNYPGMIDVGHAMGTLFTVASGSPIVNTSVISTNLAGTSVFNDNFSGDTVYGLGYSVVGYLSAISVASGKTVSKWNAALAGATADAASTGGTITEANMYNAAGIVPGGGTVVATNMYGFHAGDTLCTFAGSSCYGISVDDVLADNYFAKSLQIGGTKTILAASTALKIGSKAALEFTPMTTTEMNALTPLESMVIYNTTVGKLYFYNGASWVAVGTGAGGAIASINSEVGPAITLAAGTTGTDFNVATTANTITYHLPTASATNRGALSPANWSTFNAKVDGPASSVDGEIALFDSTTGKLIKSATGTGFVKSTSGVFSTVAIINLAADVSTTILPLANGGTNKNMTAVNGGIVWTDADSQEITAAGTNGQVLQSNGAAAPSWVTLASAAMVAVTKTANYTVLITDKIIKGDATSGAFTLTLPAASTFTGYTFYIKKIDSTANAVTVDGNASETIDGALTVDITDRYQTLEIYSNGTGWDIL